MYRRTEILLGVILLTTFVLVPAPAQERSAVVAPRQVLVVNTQDASVSQVDIATMKEIRRIPVGPRMGPYNSCRFHWKASFDLLPKPKWARRLSAWPSCLLLSRADGEIARS